LTFPRSALAVLVGSVILLALPACAPAATTPDPTLAPTPTFKVPTPVDPFRVGFEPDVAVDQSPKTAGQIYTSTPFGFSTTQSFIYRSNDGGQSFHLAEGNFLGKAATCVGGGDSELQIDRVNGDVYFSDLQGLTNFSNSTSSDSGRSWNTTCTAVNATGVDRQWIGVDNNGGTKAIGDGADDGRLYEDYDNVQQNSDSDNLLGNQLVMNESVDGVHYGAKCQAANFPCPLPPAVITRDEGIPGNVVVDNTNSPFRHRVYAVHTGGTNESVVVTWCSGKDGDDTAAKVADDCTDPTQASMDPGHVNVNWHDSVVRAAPPTDQKERWLTGFLFASVAVDQAGNIYVTWSEYPYHLDDSGNTVVDGPGVVRLAESTDGAKTWKGPYNISPPALGNNVMPWVTAGSPGRVGIAWYGAEEAEENGNFGPDTLDHGLWNVYYAESIDALDAAPKFTIGLVSDHPAKFGNISTQGLGGSPDRSLGDFMQVQTGTQGEAVISYVDDTSADRNPDYCQGCGQTPSEAAGPIMIVRQNTGQSLFAGAGELGGGPQPFRSVTDATGGYPDAFYSAQGSDTDAPKSLDVVGVAVDQPDPGHLQFTMKTADPDLASHLTGDPSLGGPSDQWLVRWAAPTYKAPGDGNQFYVGLQAGQDGSPQFYGGTTCAIGTTHSKYFTYPTMNSVPGSIMGDTITWTVPLTQIGTPGLGDSLFSVTGMTMTQPFPSNSSGNSGCPELVTGEGDENIPNLIDASPPFTYTLGVKEATKTTTAPSGVVPGTSCAADSGFASTSVRRSGRGLRIAFTRAVKRPATIDVFQVTRGQRITGNHLVARFSRRTKSFTWSGKPNRRHRRVVNGYYFVRFRMALPGGHRDDRRAAQIRRRGRFGSRPSFYRRTDCGEIRSFKLEREVFGGPSHRSVGIAYRLRDDARVTVTVLRGKHVVRRWTNAAARQHRTYRLRLAAGKLKRGNYRVRLTAVEGATTTTASLTTRRI
jgi:hypothetical protein